jgi:hypothetical protein
MAKKKTTTNFDPGRFRMGEEASMATIPQTPLQQLQKSTQVAAIDPYYVRDPITGLSPAQVEANQAVAEAAAATGMQVTPGATGPRATSARVSTTPIVVATQPAPGGSTGGAVGGDGGAAAAAAAAAAALAAKQAADLAAEEKRRAGQSAYALLFAEFERYGLGALVADLKGFIEQGLSQAEFTLKLRETPAYQKRFAANTQRIGKGLRALSEAEYIGLEDQYQNIMRQYGLPESYYSQSVDPTTGIKTQPGFQKFIAGDVSAAELEDRIQTAQNRVINANPEVGQALRQFYPDITNGDILAYALDPDKALTNIKRKVTAAEIQGAANMAGLNLLGANATPEQIAAARARAVELETYGVTGAQAREGFQAVAGVLPRASMLGDIYAKQGLGEYTQATAEQEVFGLTGSAEAERKRRKLSELEQAQFAGSSGAAQGALARERAGSF